MDENPWQKQLDESAETMKRVCALAAEIYGLSKTEDFAQAVCLRAVSTLRDVEGRGLPTEQEILAVCLYVDGLVRDIAALGCWMMGVVAFVPEGDKITKVVTGYGHQRQAQSREVKESVREKEPAENDSQ